MSNIDDDLVNILGNKSTPETNYSVSDNITAIDADTFEVIDPDTGERKVVRLAGGSSPEQLQIDRSGSYKTAELGGAEAHALSASLAREGRFDEARFIGEKGAYDRQLGDLVNPEGQSFTAEGLKSGFFDTSVHSSQAQVDAYQLGRIERRGNPDEVTAFDLASDVLNGIKAQGALEAKPWAPNTVEYAKAPDAYQGAAIIPEGRWENNESKNWFSDSLELGGTSVLEGWYGTADLLATQLNFDPDNNWGDRQLEKLDYDRSQGASTAFLDPFDAQGDWKLDSFTDYYKFLVGNLAVSAPAMLNTFVATIAAPATGGLSFASPLSVYTGQNWAAQPEDKKNAGLALIAGVGQTVLDRFGIGALGVGKNLFLNPTLKAQAISQIAKSKGISEEAAEAVLTSASKRELAQASVIFRDHLGQQLLAKNLVRNAGVRTGFGAAGEGLTEAAQELIGAFAETGTGVLSDDDKEQLGRRLLTAGIAGSSLGGLISFTGAGAQSFGDLDAFKSYETIQKEKAADEKRKEDDKKWQVETGQGDGKQTRTRSKVVKDLTQEAASHGFIAENSNLEELAAPAIVLEKGKNAARKLKDYFKYRGIAAGLTQGGIDSLSPAFSERGRVSSGLFGAWGGHNGLIGATKDLAYRSTKAALGQFVNNGQQDQAKFKMSEEGISNLLRDEDVTATLKEIAAIWADPTNSFSSFQEIYESGWVSNIIPAKYESQIENILSKGQELEVFTMQGAEYEGTQYSPGSFYDWKPFDKDRIEYDRKAIAEIFEAEGLNPQESQDLIDSILLSDDVDATNTDLYADTGFDDESIYVNAGQDLKSKIRKALNSDAFKDYTSTDIFFAQEARASQVAHRKTSKDFFDRDGNNIAAILQLQHKLGEITQEEMAYLAKEFLDQMQIEKGEYHKTSAVQRKIENHLMFYSSTATLPLATVSSLVETAMINFGLTPEQMYNNMMPALKSVANEMGNWMNEGTTKINLTHRADMTTENFGKSLNKGLGYESSAAGARFRQEATGNRGWQQRILDGFFKAIFLGPWTNALRISAAGAGADVIHGWVQNIAFDIKEGRETQIGRESRDALTELGINIDRLQMAIEADTYSTTIVSIAKKKGLEDVVDPNDPMAGFEDELRTALMSFVDGRVAHPTKTNRPKLYFDQRFRLFFHFQGFVSAFTSDILPKIYKNLVRGTPGLKYNAFMTIGSLLALGFLSQLMKDEIKYGEPSPWLEDWKLFQRALYSSGLLGVGERAINLAAPLYNERSSGPGSWIFNRAIDEAPALGYLGGIAEAGTKIAGGDVETGVRQGSKAIPGLGPFYGVRSDLGELAKDIFGGK